jgi:hypothetical protein
MTQRPTLPSGAEVVGVQGRLVELRMPDGTRTSILRNPDTMPELEAVLLEAEQRQQAQREQERQLIQADSSGAGAFGMGIARLLGGGPQSLEEIASELVRDMEPSADLTALLEPQAAADEVPLSRSARPGFEPGPQYTTPRNLPARGLGAQQRAQIEAGPALPGGVMWRSTSEPGGAGAPSRFGGGQGSYSLGDPVDAIMDRSARPENFAPHAALGETGNPLTARRAAEDAAAEAAAVGAEFDDRDGEELVEERAARRGRGQGRGRRAPERSAPQGSPQRSQAPLEAVPPERVGSGFEPMSRQPAGPPPLETVPPELVSSGPPKQTNEQERRRAGVGGGGEEVEAGFFAQPVEREMVRRRRRDEDEDEQRSDPGPVVDTLARGLHRQVALRGMAGAANRTRLRDAVRTGGTAQLRRRRGE